MKRRQKKNKGQQPFPIRHTKPQSASKDESPYDIMAYEINEAWLAMSEDERNRSLDRFTAAFLAEQQTKKGEEHDCANQNVQQV